MRDLQPHDPFAGEFLCGLATQLHVFRGSENPFVIERIHHHVDSLSTIFLPDVMVPAVECYLALAIDPPAWHTLAIMTVPDEENRPDSYPKKTPNSLPGPNYTC